MIFLEQNFSFESLPLGEKISLCVLGLGILLFFLGVGVGVRNIFTGEYEVGNWKLWLFYLFLIGLGILGVYYYET